jgi:ABC-type dipeptide/oligopeptide/nickel transport system permease subunit
MNSLQLREFWFFFRQNKGAVLGLILICVFLMIAIFAPWLAPFEPSNSSEYLRLPPSWSQGGAKIYWLGTDDLGRDLLSRLIYGSRVSLMVGFFSVALSLIIGSLLGLWSGYAGGKVDFIIMRAMDVMMALPSILFAIVVVAILGPNLSNTIVAVALVSVPGFVRLMRALVMAEKKKNYVVASGIYGASHWRQTFQNILPNCSAPMIVQATLGFSDGILNAAALGFLGLGAQPPTPEWGVMLSDARSFIESSPWLVTLPGLCILIVVLSFNLLGDGLRDALDPRLKR